MGHPDLEVEAAGRGVLITGGEETVGTLRWMDPHVKADISKLRSHLRRRRAILPRMPIGIYGGCFGGKHP